YGENQVVAILRQNRVRNSISEEIGRLEELRRIQGLGRFVVDATLVTVGPRWLPSFLRQPAMVMPRYAEGSKHIIELRANQYLNQKSIQQIEQIRAILKKEKIIIGDLQFLVGKDGSVVISDPGKLYFGKVPDYRYPFDALIEIARANIARR